MSDRENLRFERTRVFGRARRLFLAMGHELHAYGVVDDPRDVFFLTTQEVLGAIEGCGLEAFTPAGLTALIRARRDDMQRFASLPDPPERIHATGPAAAGNRLTTAPMKCADGPERFGTGCSAGSLRSRAKVVVDPRREQVSPGEIMVARHTDPGWIALFANASGIVVERGSLLSHSAIVARELGIPCIVGLKDATKWIATGDALEIDGSTGRVRKVDA